MLTNIKKDGELQQTVIPPVNIRETDKEVTLEAEMAGVRKEDISLELKDDELVISAVRKEPDQPKEYRIVHRERYPLHYRRSFVLGAEVSKQNISADLDNGILTVHIPKSEETLPRKIPVK